MGVAVHGGHAPVFPLASGIYDHYAAGNFVYMDDFTLDCAADRFAPFCVLFSSYANSKIKMILLVFPSACLLL